MRWTAFIVTSCKNLAWVVAGLSRTERVRLRTVSEQLASRCVRLAVIASVLACSTTIADDSSGGGISKLGWVDFEIIQGRITAVNPRFKKTKQHSTINSEGLGEKIALSVQASIPSITYALRSDDCTMDLAVEKGNRVAIHWVSSSRETRFTQRESGPLVMTISHGGESEKITGPTLWHLVIGHPETCREHLLPVLDRIRPQWNVETTARGIQDCLFRQANGRRLVSQDFIEHLIDKLDSRHFHERRQASRQLRALGPTALATLERLDKSALTIEQRFRVHQLGRSLSTLTGDTPERTAAWLLDNPRIWLALMSHDELEKRRLATRHLSRISSRSIDFNPLAGKDERQAQIARLRSASFMK